MRVLACTGGIGSGKTYVSKIFFNMGIPVYYSDNRAKLLYNSNAFLLKQMVKLLGDDILKNGVLQRDVVAGKIFNNSKLLMQVESIVHPAVLNDFSNWKEHIVQNKEIGEIPFVIFESAIILEKPFVRSIADKILNVSAPLNLRVKRVMERDSICEEKVRVRLAAQWDDNKREAMADFIIFADGKRALLPQVLAVKEAMCKL
ncbi:MAG: dephospho-CoA kinase [Bacteroidales bacterium]